MDWLLDTIKSSVGKKLLMAFTGLCFMGFLGVHLAGNLTLYGGKLLFNAYAEHLHALGPLIVVAEWVLLTLAFTHVIAGATLFYQNFTARPVRYEASKSAGGKTLASATMPYTGALILIFVVIHLINFHFVDKTTTTIYDIVTTAFSNPLYVGFYVVMMAAVGLHVSHGFWSLFQTLGASHPKYFPAIEKLGLLISVVFGLGFGLIPIYLSVFI
ncbi:MAG: succinate dehydrogenase cytochrome b subunit [Desulfobacteraceae bacterium]|nr:succinate dehydrogenase cytochrome b subunit [Desulfobacteraceae bacterium]MBU4001155.1 succinate dehydrogenase cytochrome b subunit [Pseudomonadota bacterium]